MAKNPKRLVAFTFILAAALFELAAVLPVVKGRPLNAAFLGVGVVFLVLGLAQLKAAKDGTDKQAT
jgi:hypothetical protein